MVNFWGYRVARKTQSNHVSPSVGPGRAGSDIPLTQVEEGSSSRGEISPIDVVPAERLARTRPKKSLKASIWVKLTLFIGTLVRFSHSARL